MTHSTSDDNSVLLVHAYLDDELDPANALEIAQRMRADPALAAEGERVKALQQLIHERLPREAAPPFRPPFFAGALSSFLPRPEPLFLPPPVSLLTVAQARRFASFSGVPRSS